MTELHFEKIDRADFRTVCGRKCIIVAEKFRGKLSKPLTKTYGDAGDAMKAAEGRCDKLLARVTRKNGTECWQVFEVNSSNGDWYIDE